MIRSGSGQAKLRQRSESAVIQQLGSLQLEGLSHVDASTNTCMPASTIPTIHGSARTAPPRPNPAAGRGEDRHRPRDCLPLVEGAGVSRAKDPKRLATRSSPLPAEPTARIAAILDPHSLLCRSSGGTAHMPPPKRSESQRRHLDAFLRFCRRLTGCAGSVSGSGRAKKLENWIDSIRASGFPFVAQFAITLCRDLEAVELSITMPWSNGPIEGHINRLKAIKRQMYGRAGFELLKARVLPWDISKAA